MSLTRSGPAILVSMWACLVMLAAGVGVPAKEVATHASEGLERFSLDVVFLAARQGTRALARRRLVLQPGMESQLDQSIPRQIGGNRMAATCHLEIHTVPAKGDAVDLDLRSTLSLPEDGGVWRSHSQGALKAGTSNVMELAPADDAGERLVLSVTLHEVGADEPLTARAVQVEMRIRVTGVEGDREVLLHEPHLRTISGRWTEFSFDYPVPAAAGNPVDHVRMALKLLPGYPRQGKLPLKIDLTGSFPTSSQPLYFSRAQSALLRRDEIWQDTFSPPGGTGPGLHLALTVAWASF